MQGTTTNRAIHRFRTSAVLSASVVFAVTLAGCSSSGSGSGSGGASADYVATPATVTDVQRDAIFQTAFLTPDVKPVSVDPAVRQGLDEIGRDYTPEQITKAEGCLNQPTCKIGDGKQTLAILDGAGSDLWRHITRGAITLQATAYPHIGTVMYLQADGDLQTMQAQLRTLVTRQVTGIVAYDDFGPAMTAAFQQAKTQGIPIATYGGTPGPDAVNAVVTQVQSDFCNDGNNMAEAAHKMIGDTGNVAFFTGTPGNPQGAGWQACAEKWFKANAPGIQVVNKANTSWTEGGTTTATSALISTGKKVDAVLYDYSKQTVNIVQAYTQARVKVPDQITWTSDNSLLKMWEQDQKSGTPWKLAYSSSINFEGNVALAALMNHLAGKAVPGVLNFPLPFVDAKVGDYKSNQPANGPGPTLMPEQLLKTILAG